MRQELVRILAVSLVAVAMIAGSFGFGGVQQTSAESNCEHYQTIVKVSLYYAAKHAAAGNLADAAGNVDNAAWAAGEWAKYCQGIV